MTQIRQQEVEDLNRQKMGEEQFRVISVLAKYRTNLAIFTTTSLPALHNNLKAFKRVKYILKIEQFLQIEQKI